MRRVEPHQAVYSLAYDGAPPEGEFLRASFHAGENAAGACGRYSDDQRSTSDFWYLLLTLNRSDLGEYPIVPDLRDEAGPRASIRVIHVKDWARLEDYPAVGGALTIAAVPADAEGFRAATTLGGRLEAEFPVHPLQQVECSGEAAPGSVARMWCVCQDASGQQSTCESDGGNCCVALDGERMPFVLEFEAAPCAAMCVASPGLLSYCDALRF